MDELVKTYVSKSGGFILIRQNSGRWAAEHELNDRMRQAACAQDLHARHSSIFRLCATAPLLRVFTTNIIMKFSTLALGALAAVATFAGVNAAVESSEASTMHIRIRVHNEKQGAICYKQCPKGQHCARGTNTCRAPKKNSSECFNPATSLWIGKCDSGFTCVDGKCAVGGGNSHETGNANGAICYKQCPHGQHCARGTTTCRAPKSGTSECFNPATSLWIAKCDHGFWCNNGVCSK